MCLAQHPLASSHQAFTDPVYQAQCVVDLVRHRDFEEQKYQPIDMQSLRVIARGHKVKTVKSKSEQRDLLVHSSCHVLNILANTFAFPGSLHVWLLTKSREHVTQLLSMHFFLMYLTTFYTQLRIPVNDHLLNPLSSQVGAG